MGCMCSRPQAEEFAGAQADVRARYSTDSVRHNAEFLQDAAVLGLHVHGRHPPSTANSAGRRTRNTVSSSSSSLTRSQWKQMRALARSNTNPHIHQLQQLQLLPSHALNHNAQQQPAALALAGLHTNHIHHHLHRHHQPMVHATLSPRHGFEAPQHQGLAFSSIAMSHGHHASSFSSSKDKDRSHAAKAKEALSPEQVIALCGAVVDEEGCDYAAAGIPPLLLASICLIESGGCPCAKHFRDHVGDVALGICQMLLSTAQWLASSKGFDKYGSSPTAADLEDPKCCLYYCAAYLSVLSRHGGSQRGESFVVRAYHSGPKAVDSDAAVQYWQKYLKAKHCLREVVRAMAVTVATAAASAGLPLDLPTGVADVAPTATASAGWAAVGGVKAASECSSSSRGGSRCSSRRSSACSDVVHNSSKDTACIGKHNEDLMVWAGAAKLIADLSSSWANNSSSADAQQKGATGDAAVSSGSGSFISQILPSFWASGGSSRTQQQEQQQQQSGGRSTSNSARGKRQQNADDANASDSKGAMQVVPVTRAALDAALLRLACIDPGIMHIALSNAAAAAALHGKRHSRATPDASQQSSAGSKGSSSGHWYSLRRSSNSASNSSSAAADEGDSSLAFAPPCVMHVVGHGETLTQISSICGIAVPDILAANPDLTDGSAVQVNDCIALPVPVVSPRIYVIQSGDTLHSIAKAHKTSLGRIIARNPELTDTSRVQSGWVIVLPGLKGDSKCGSALQWLAEAAAAEVESADVTSYVTDRGLDATPRFRNMDDEDVGGFAGSGFSGEGSVGFRRGTRHQGSGMTLGANPRAVRAGLDPSEEPSHEEKDVHREGVSHNADVSSPEDTSTVDQSSSVTRDARSSTGAAAVAVEVHRSSKDWSYAGCGAAVTMHTAAIAPAYAAGAEEIKATAPTASIGSGLFMFAVGQAVV